MIDSVGFRDDAIQSAGTHCSPIFRWAFSGPKPEMSEEGEPMANDYEVTYILRPHIDEAEFDGRIAEIAEHLKKNGGEVISVDKMGKRRLAYEIDDVREGFYVVMNFKSTGEQARELERQLRLNEDVMRALLIRLDEPAPLRIPPPEVAAPAAV